MPIDAAATQAVIISRVGDYDPVTRAPVADGTGVLGLMVPQFWAYWASKALVWPRLQALYTERDAIRCVIALLRPLVDSNTGQSLQLRLSQQVSSLQTDLKTVQDQIDRELKRARVSRATVGALAALTATAPQLPPQVRPTPIDPNDPTYTGSPYFPVTSLP